MTISVTLSLRALALLGAVALAAPATAQETGPDPAAVRRAARDAGLDSLRRVKPARPEGLTALLKPGRAGELAAIQLGKALFWDMQIGSDGQACASCHFHAGADNRTKNQLNPGAHHTDPALRDVFHLTASGGGGPNYDLTPEDFPFHQLEDDLSRTSPVLHDTDDVCSSQGVRHALFGGVTKGTTDEIALPHADLVFSVGGANVRRTASRNAPSVINAVFNNTNFWDGSAHNVFNGVNGLGPLDPGATILVVESKKLVPRVLRLPNSSLASQALAPPRSDVEMAFSNRPFRELARKLMKARPLARQLVHPKDSVLGSLSKAKLSRGQVTGRPGIAGDYETLIKKAFAKPYWDSSKKVDGYSLMENNFGLFLGVAIQLYESTLVSDRTAFDAFMEGDDGRLGPGPLEGLLTFINRGPERSANPVFERVRAGNCVTCHAGPAFTSAAFDAPPGTIDAPAAVALQETVELVGEDLAVVAATALRDRGFSNIGVRPIAEDLGRGGTAAGFPLSFARQGLLGLAFAPPLPLCGGAGQPPCAAGARVAVDGAFKVPGLRNVELSGPYFHNGGQATLRQVMVFYERLGDFSDESVHDLDPELARIELRESDQFALVDFLLALTDDRVRDERAPFDHPQLFVPHGHPGDGSALACPVDRPACDALIAIPAVSDKGRTAAGLAPLGTFLGLDPLE